MKPWIALLVLSFGIGVMLSSLKVSVARDDDEILVTRIELWDDTKGSRFLMVQRSDGDKWLIKALSIGFIEYQRDGHSITLYGQGWKRRLDFLNESEATAVMTSIRQSLGLLDVNTIYERE